MQEKNHIPVFSVNQLNFYFKIPKLQDNFSCRQDFPPSSTRCGKHRVLRYWRWVKGSARYRKDTSTGDYGEMLYSLPPPPNPEVTHLSSNYSFYPPNGDMDNIFICIKNVIIFMCLWDFFPPSSVKNLIGNLIGIALNLLVVFGCIVSFTVLIFPTQEHGISLHMLMLSLISFITVL